MSEVILIGFRTLLPVSLQNGLMGSKLQTNTTRLTSHRAFVHLLTLLSIQASLREGWAVRKWLQVGSESGEVDNKAGMDVVVTEEMVAAGKRCVRTGETTGEGLMCGKGELHQGNFLLQIVVAWAVL